jgi:penicillin-insensitive murein endopeptidase
MSWRRGELWLDTDVLWFREGAGAPAVAAVVPPSVASLPPPGLVASRRRRAAWRQRRHARRAWATALALSPAVTVALASLRGDGDQGSKVVAEDSPSLTLRPGTGTGGIAVDPARLMVEREGVGIGPGSPSAAKPKRRHPSFARAEASTKLAWHHATSIGLPYEGSLIDGTQLPVEGPNWVTWNPVTDSVPDAPNRLYGNDRTIRAIISVSAAYRAANPGAPRVVIGDISLRGGGPMTDEHISHQNGLDVDVYFPRLDGTPRAPLAPDEIDHRLAQDLLDRFVAAGAQMIFVGDSTGLQGPVGVVIPYSGHDYHMHVRFPPPGG